MLGPHRYTCLPLRKKMSLKIFFYYIFLRILSPVVTESFTFIYCCWAEIWSGCIITQPSLELRSACSCLLSGGLIIRILIIVESFSYVCKYLMYRQYFLFVCRWSEAQGMSQACCFPVLWLCWKRVDGVGKGRGTLDSRRPACLSVHLLTVGS